MTAMTAITGTTEDTPDVRLQPCAAFHFDPDAAWPACGDCGWLEDDHPGAVDAGGAVITELPPRRVAVPQRLAS
ncbi:MAG TPA: hypothetical protein VKC52_14370 [Acidimicrobiia bacterium]|nr:hypothetical protein [Acidimicrobiia bacterium]